MNNKDEKTFADLFSSSTSEQKDEQEQIEKSNNKEVSFDNIFDNLTNNNENKVEEISNPFINIEEIKEDNKKVENDSINSNFESKDFSFFNLSDQPEIVPNIEEKETSQDLKISFENKDDNEEIKSTEVENNNPFFEKESTEEKETSQDLGISFENKDDNEEIKSTEVENNNPFFEINSKEEKETSQDLEISFENKDNNEEIKSTEVENNNPFFEKESTEENEPSKEIEVSFETKNEKEETSTTEEINNNPFGTNEDTQVLAGLNIMNSNTESPIETKNDVTSPFFQEEQSTNKDNPFFGSTINLVENNVHNAPKGTLDTSTIQNYNVKIVKQKEPLIKVILGVMSYALFIWLLLIGITLLVYVLDIKIRAAKGDYSAPKYNAYVVLTGSMLPEIKVSDVVVTKKVDAKELKEGDIITFASADSRFQGTIITHRIIKKNPKTDKTGYTFQTKGDNNNIADSALVPEANIYGKVILKIPKLGYLQEFLASDGGWIIVILIPCLTVISYDIVKLGKGLKRKKNKSVKVQK